MELEILGSGGAFTTPRPGCQCRICAAARAQGIPFARSGPAVFVHGFDLLIDTPEEIKDQLNRANVAEVRAALYSHWHPDHTAGCRVWEALNKDSRRWPPQPRCTTVYLPQQVAVDWGRYLGLEAQFAYLTQLGVLRVATVPDGTTLDHEGLRITPLRLAEDYVYAFLLEHADRRILIAMDELKGWQPPATLRGVDLAILPMGIPYVHPLTGAHTRDPDLPVWQTEATFAETLDIATALAPQRLVLLHIEANDDLTPAELTTVATQVRASHGLPLEFAWDGMRLSV